MVLQWEKLKICSGSTKVYNTVQDIWCHNSMHGTTRGRWWIGLPQHSNSTEPSMHRAHEPPFRAVPPELLANRKRVGGASHRPPASWVVVGGRYHSAPPRCLPWGLLSALELSSYRWDQPGRLVRQDRRVIFAHQTGNLNTKTGHKARGLTR